MQDLSRIRIVLVQTSHPGNIGATARAMKNMGLQTLYLVNPKEFPSGVALGRAASALDILDAAVVVDNLDAAIADCGLVIGTSARSRGIPWPMVTPDECAERLVQACGQNEVALVFGREDSGLSNDELRRCHFHVQIPASEDYSSLNVAAAAMVLCYEVRKAALQCSSQDRSGNQTTAGNSEKGSETVGDIWDQPLATVADMEGLLAHLEEVLTQLAFLDPKAPRQLMTRLRRLYTRIRPDRMEINILRGMLTAVQAGLKRNTGKGKGTSDQV